ncbi:multiple epidermal growth factor-like domains protein 10 [Dreissena polymorpha]|uniref:multiple epidermal growth factor-like domains protein 10 n=1 Tax=Dreissena polymorpha TaxID=45954 RepID=UPI002264D365|nr:multiple epidermal growth factor-like domains protein 10 [Dreissena polymorpha]
MKYGSYCHCGNTILNATQKPESECATICSGDRSQLCGSYNRIYLYRHWDCPVGNYSINCAKQCHCREGPCDKATGACGNDGCKDGWKGTACNESCELGSYSVNCSKQCNCRVGPCDGVTGACGYAGCKDGWTGISCNQNCPVGNYSINCAKQCYCRDGPCDKVTGACGNDSCKDGWKGIACNETDEVKEQSSTIIWIAPTLALCLLIVVVTITACLCIRRKKKKREQKAVQLNELRPSDIPLELIDSNSGNYDVFPYDNNDDNTDNYDVIPDDNNYDNTDHYDVLPDDNNGDKTDPYDALPDDVHDDFVVPYAVVPLDNTEREATPMYRSLQSQITDDYLHTGLGDSSYMIPASSYVLGRICESITSDQTHSAVAEELDNAATLAIQYKASEELINVTKEITTNASAEKLFDYGKSEDKFEAETNNTDPKQEKNDESGETNYTEIKSQITDDYLHTGLREFSYMIPASSYVLDRICESETSDQTHSAVAEELDNAATLEIQYKASLKK